MSWENKLHNFENSKGYQKSVDTAEFDVNKEALDEGAEYANRIAKNHSRITKLPHHVVKNSDGTYSASRDKTSGKVVASYNNGATMGVKIVKEAIVGDSARVKVGHTKHLVKITIDTNGPAFDGSEDEEVADILMKIARDFEKGKYGTDKLTHATTDITDSRGSSAGSMEII